jgi:hypothetical protein
MQGKDRWLSLVNTAINHQVLSATKSVDQLLHSASYVNLNLEGIEKRSSLDDFTRFSGIR